MSHSIAIIGAGLSGLVCARRLQAAGHSVRIFEKSRGVGGRMATRRAEGFGEFDHGAQYFTATSPEFSVQVQAWVESGVVQEWAGSVGVVRHGEFRRTSQETMRYVAVPSMTAIAKELARDQSIVLQQRVVGIEREQRGSVLVMESQEQFGPFDWVISSAPAPQSAAIFQPWKDFTKPFVDLDLEPCWAVMIASSERIDTPFDGMFVEDSPLSWICRQGSRPSRQVESDRWVLHASPAWSRVHIEDSPQAAQDQLIEAFWKAVGFEPRELSFTQIHRWRFSIPLHTLEVPYLLDADLGFAVCGDWCAGPKIEGAWRSGDALGRAIVASSRNGK